MNEQVTGDRVDHLHPRVDDWWLRSVGRRWYGCWRRWRRWEPTDRKRRWRGRYESGWRTVSCRCPHQLFTADTDVLQPGQRPWSTLVGGRTAVGAVSVMWRRRLVLRHKHPAMLLLLLFLLQQLSVSPAAAVPTVPVLSVPAGVVVCAGQVASLLVDDGARRCSVERVLDDGLSGRCVVVTVLSGRRRLVLAADERSAVDNWLGLDERAHCVD